MAKEDKKGFGYLKVAVSGEKVSSGRFYVGVIGLLCKLRPVTEELLAYLAENIQEESITEFTNADKTAFASRVDASFDTVSNCMTELKDKGLLEKKGTKRGVYQLNPLYFPRKTDYFSVEINCKGIFNSI